MKKFLGILIATMMLLSPINVAVASTYKTTTHNLNTESVDADDIPAEAVNTFLDWRDVGWHLIKEAGKFVERQIKLDGKSTVGRDGSMYLISPTINYNHGNVGPEFYFRPKITNKNCTIDMHSHRLFSLDIFAQMSIILSDPYRNTVASKNVGTNQYLTYKFEKHEALGSWKAQYITNGDNTWQNYFRVSVGSSAYSIPEWNGMESNVFYGENGRVYIASNRANSQTDKSAHTHSSGKVLSLNELEDEFRDDNNRVTDQMVHYAPGQELLVSSPLRDVYYDKARNATAFVYTIKDVRKGNEDKTIKWYFDGDLTSRYKKGDAPVFKFTVRGIGVYAGQKFESLDFIEDVLILQSSGEYPPIERYLMR
ncbi:hypothetical protein [Mobiluncus mulieris]|uniref:hypothetical protein n=1 Tax=Mobiluncus mulieris TaxID=2052 RepID=UPI000E02738D|nr:hypothetical protein [Mobiluncus mulieris]STY83401.1 Uncharacterised protein [Mobiluncus mulieris]